MSTIAVRSSSVPHLILFRSTAVGYMAEYEVKSALRDAIRSTIYSGTWGMRRNITARCLGL
ncbi:MAG TPA: hypothetical protein VJ734_09500 [Nitrosospira sp.]|nr:hypothetical protein [Nitrosospira sp.]